MWPRGYKLARPGSKKSAKTQAKQYHTDLHATEGPWKSAGHLALQLAMFRNGCFDNLDLFTIMCSKRVWWVGYRLVSTCTAPHTAASLIVLSLADAQQRCQMDSTNRDVAVRAIGNAPIEEYPDHNIQSVHYHRFSLRHIHLGHSGEIY